MARWLLVWLILPLLVLGPGCHLFPKADASKECCPAPAQEGPVLRVKAPPQKIIVEQPVCVAEQPCKPEPEPKKETKPESAPKRESKPESTRERLPEADDRVAEADVAPEGALSTLAALGQVASLSRTMAMTSPLGTVNPGGCGLGVGMMWINIPIPCLRLFRVQETPSITVPLNEANIMPVGGGIAPGLLAADHRRVAGRGLSRDEIAALVAQELSAQRRRPPTAPSPPPDDEERKRLEKKLSTAEAQIERLAELLKAVDDKLPAQPGDKAPVKKP